MRYNDIFTNIILIVLMLLLISKTFIKSSLNIIVTSFVHNDDISIKLNVKYLFNLININKTIYPKENKKSKEKKIKQKQVNKNKINIKDIEIQDIKNILELIKKIDIEELYSDINFGNTNINFTCFIYVLINIIYSNIINLTNSKKVYLNVNHNFIENKIDWHSKLHIKITIKQIILMSISSIRLYKNIKINKKEGDSNEVNGSNTKPYGKNI